MKAPRLYQVRQGAEQRRKRLLKKVRVVGLTCCAAMLPVLDGLTFDTVVLDECSQITEPLSIVPLTRSGTCRQHHWLERPFLPYLGCKDPYTSLKADWSKTAMPLQQAASRRIASRRSKSVAWARDSTKVQAALHGSACGCMY